MERQCKTCGNKDYADKLMCCAANRLGKAWNDLLKAVPILGARIEEYECGAYYKEETNNAD